MALLNEPSNQSMFDKPLVRQIHLNGQPREGDGHLLGTHDPLRRLGHGHIQLGCLLEQGFLKGIFWFRGKVSKGIVSIFQRM